MTDNPLAAVEPRALAARVREAREARGWTQQELGDRLGMARTTIVAIEKAERRLKPRELIELARLLGRNVSELLQWNSPPEGFSEQLRSALPVSAPVDYDLVPYIEEFQHRCEDYLRLEEICHVPLSRRYPPEYDIQGVDPDQAAEDLAAAERSRLDLGEGPVLSLRDLLETEVGLRVFQLDLPSKIAGMFAFAASLGGCIAINLRHPVERRRMSLAHEYGHFLIARFRFDITFEGRYERKPAAERFAEAFARAFLMPASGVRRRFLEHERERPQGITYGDLRRLAHSYLVSLEAMTRRLEELRLIPLGTWERLRQERSRVDEARQLLGLESAVHTDDAPFSSRYIALAIEAWQQGELSEGQLARILRVDRLGARELALAAADGSDQGALVNFGAPLFSSGSR